MYCYRYQRFQSQEGTNLMPIFLLSGTNLQSSLQHSTSLRRRYLLLTRTTSLEEGDGVASKTFPTRKTWAPYYHHLHPCQPLLYNIIVLPFRMGSTMRKMTPTRLPAAQKEQDLPIQRKQKASIAITFQLTIYVLSARWCVNQLSSGGKLSICFWVAF